MEEDWRSLSLMHCGMSVRRRERARRNVIREVSNDGKGKAPSIPHSSFSALAPSTKTLSLLSGFPLPHYIPKTIAPFPSPAASNLGRAKTNVFAAAGVLEKRTKDRETEREGGRFHFH